MARSAVASMKRDEVTAPFAVMVGIWEKLSVAVIQRTHQTKRKNCPLMMCSRSEVTRVMHHRADTIASSDALDAKENKKECIKL